jgi:hypothetical protein
MEKQEKTATQFVVNPKNLSGLERDKEFNKDRTVIKTPIIILDGNGQTLIYAIDNNSYHGGFNTPALEGEALLSALSQVRWAFTDFNKSTKDQFPPTPENINAKRKELFGAIKGMPSKEDIEFIQLKTSPTHIEPNSVWKKEVEEVLATTTLEQAKRLARGAL